VFVLAATALVVVVVTQWIATPWQVRGDSMEPTLRDGDRVIVDLWTLGGRSPNPREIVVVRGPDDEEIVKRVAREGAGGANRYPDAWLPAESPLESTFILLGDNPDASTDSRTFGRVPRHRIHGRVVWRYWPPSGWGKIE